MVTFWRRSLVVVGVAIWAAFAQSLAYGATATGPKPFVVFDGTQYANKPNFLSYNIHPMKVVYAQEFGYGWYNDPNALPPIQAVQSVAQKAKLKGDPVMLDIEHWRIYGTPEVVQASLTKYLTVLSWFRNIATGLSISYYSRPPIRDYWSAIQDLTNAKRQLWMANNDKLVSLAVPEDVIYPSLYTFYPDQAG